MRKIKIGIINRNSRPDLNVKYVTFEANGTVHTMHFRYSHLKGIERNSAIFDGHPAKIIDAYPPLLDVVRICASIILGDVKFIVGNFAHKMIGHNQLDKHKPHQ